MAKNNIKSLSSFKTHSVSLEFHEVDDGYVPAITMFLDDGSPPSDDIKHQKIINIVTDTILTKTDADIIAFAGGMTQLFAEVDEICTIVSENGDSTERNLVEILKQQKTGKTKKFKSGTVSFY